LFSQVAKPGLADFFLMPTHKPVVISELFGELVPSDTQRWTVIHTKPRQEKKLADYATREGITYYLPQIESSHVYNHRKVSFQVPMFPGYIFVRINETEKQRLSISGCIVNFIRVLNQDELLGELRNIYHTRKSKLDMENTVWLDQGLQVEVVKGPLKGVRGVVESHDKIGEVQLQINILRQAVRVKIKPDNLKILGEYTLVEI
jgi:transcription antitermination factor NusG